MNNSLKQALNNRMPASSLYLFYSCGIIGPEYMIASKIVKEINYEYFSDRFRLHGKTKNQIDSGNVSEF